MSVCLEDWPFEGGKMKCDVLAAHASGSIVFVQQYK